MVKHESCSACCGLGRRSDYRINWNGRMIHETRSCTSCGGTGRRIILDQEDWGKIGEGMVYAIEVIWSGVKTLFCFDYSKKMAATEIIPKPMAG